jgi:hypothetical protein
VVRPKPVWIIAAAALAATSALAVGAAAASASPAPAGACNAWTGHHPPYEVEISGVVALSRCDVWATGRPGQTLTATSRTDLLHWNGQQWSLITSPAVPVFPGGIAATSASDVWVVGSADSQTLIGHWDGTAFTRVASPDPGFAPDVNELSGVSATSASDAWAVGEYGYQNPQTEAEAVRPLVLHWDGQAWTQVPVAIPPTPDGPSGSGDLIAVTARCGCDTWAVGDYFTQSVTGSVEVTLIERWNGQAWTQVPSPNLRVSNQLNAVSADSPTDAWAVGYHDTLHEGVATLAEHWNGHAWTIVPSPDPGPQCVLLGVAAVSPGNAWAAGFYVSKFGGKDKALLLHWNGASWAQVAVPHFGPSYAPNFMYAASASSPRNVIVAGFYSGVVGVGQQALVLHYG